MQKIIILFICLCALSGCVRKTAIEQGNVMTPEMTNQLHTGMSSIEVRNIMGTPILINTFNESRYDYVYTFKPGRGALIEKRVILHFEANQLKNIKVYMPSGETNTSG